MPCRIGITTNPDNRRAFWDGRVQGLNRFQLISKHYSKSAAQAAENQKADAHGCNSNPGGSGPELATWYVYHFFYTRDMGP